MKVLQPKIAGADIIKVVPAFQLWFMWSLSATKCTFKMWSLSEIIFTFKMWGHVEGIYFKFKL